MSWDRDVPKGPAARDPEGKPETGRLRCLRRRGETVLFPEDEKKLGRHAYSSLLHGWNRRWNGSLVYSRPDDTEDRLAGVTGNLAGDYAGAADFNAWTGIFREQHFI